MKRDKIIIKDPLYKQILFPVKFQKYLDSKEFQRLRFIRQVSFAEWVYPSANHTRFSHSLGAFHLMNKVLNNGLIKISKKDKEDMLLAALLHDIGHGPFSHSWETVFPHFNHEEATKEILKKLGLSRIIKIIDGKGKYSPLISSTLDMDKLDYMARDSYFAGVTYGVSETDYILQNLFVENGKLIITTNAIPSVEDIITQRINLYKSVYQHKVSMEFDFIFVKIMQRAGELLKEDKIRMNPHMRAFYDKRNTIEDLLALNDFIILTHINAWTEHQDGILSKFCKMFVGRQKMRALNLAHKKVNIEKIKKKVSKEYDLKYYFGHYKLPLRILQKPVYVKVGNKKKKLQEVSALIRFYEKQEWYVEYLFFPRDIKL